jgi:hypothetical protein
MRTSRLRVALPPLAVAAAVLAGCSSGETPATGDPPAVGTQAEPTGTDAAEAQRKETFCSEVPGLLADITAGLQAAQAPEDAPRLLGEAVDRLTAVEPPADVAPQWERLVAAWTGMRDLLGRADLQDPAANATLTPQLQALQAELVDSGAAIDDYGTTHC